jgi:hypothetical protein
MPHHLDNESGDVRGPAERAEVFRDVCGVPVDPEQPGEEDLIDQLFNSSEKRGLRAFYFFSPISAKKVTRSPSIQWERWRK